MSGTIASLGIAVDSTQAVQATTTLDKLAVSAAKTETAVDALNAASTGSASGFKTASAAINDLAGKQQTANQVLNSATISAGQYRVALQQLPFQIHNFINGVIAGQSPLVAFVQQGSQISQSFGGAGAALRAVVSSITPTTAALVIAAAAAGGLFEIFKKGQDDAYALQKAITLSGNAAGVTTGQLSTMATELAKISGTHSSAIAALTAATSTNLIPANLLQPVAQVALQLQQLTGKAIADTVNEFAALGKDPIAAVEALQQKYSFLTASVYEQIRALQSEGQTGAAGDVARAALLDAEQKQVATLTVNTGSLQRAWAAVAGSAKSAADVILGIGRKASPQEQLADLQAQRGSRPLGTLTPGFNTTQQLINDRAEGILTSQIASADKLAQQDRDRNEDATNYLALLSAEGRQIEANTQISTAAFAINQAFVQSAVQTAQATIQSQADLLEAQRSANLLSDQQYYAARKKFIDRDTQVQVAGIEAQNELIADQIAKSKQRAADIISVANDPAEVISAQAASAIEVAQYQAQIETNLRSITSLEDQATAHTKINSLQQQTALKVVDQTYKDLVRSSDDYIRSLQRQNSLSLSGIGAGQQSRDRAGQLSDINSRYEQQARDLAAERERNPQQIDDAEFARRSDAIKAGLANATAEFDKYYKDLDAKQGDWVNGAKEALNNYVDAASNVANLADQAFTSAFQHIEDAIVNFATTGKFSFKSFADSILGDLVRMETKILESQALSSILGFLNPGAGVAAYADSEATSITDLIGGLGGLATGGDANAGTPYLIGEKGPELFVPKQGGTVIPNNKLGALGGGSGVTISQQFNFSSGANVAQLEAAAVQIKAQTLIAVQDGLKRGSILAPVR